MNNKVNSKKPYDVFLLGVFLLHYYALPSVIYLFITLMTPSSDEVVLIFFYTFFIVFIPSAITTFVFYITQEKASSYYCRYFLLALLMPLFLIPILTTLFDLIYLNRWHDAIDMLVANYLGYSIPCGILGVAQLVLAQACFIKIWDTQ